MDKPLIGIDEMMFHARVGADGTVTFTIPPIYLPDLANQLISIRVGQSKIIPPVLNEPVDANGYPIGYFERLDAIEADDLIERPD